MTNGRIKPLTLEIEQSVWEQFKNITPRTKTLNDAVVELIEKEVRKKIPVGGKRK